MAALTLGLAGLALALAIAAGGAHAEVRARDDAGVDVVLPAPARRIVSLAPHATEMLFANGAGARVVGVVKGSDHPAAAAGLPVVGDAQALDLERIVALAPDLVVTWPYTASAQVAKLRARGIAVYTTDPAAIDGIATNLERLARLAGSPDAGAAAAARFRERIARATAGPRAKDTPRVFYEIWGSPVYTIGGSHLITQAIAACGGENVFAALAMPAPQVGIEAVLAARPDVIIAGTDGANRPSWLEAWRRWPELPAVRDDQLHTVDADLLHRPGPRFADGVAALCAVLERARVARTGPGGARLTAR